MFKPPDLRDLRNAFIFSWLLFFESCWEAAHILVGDLPWITKQLEGAQGDKWLTVVLNAALRGIWESHLTSQGLFHPFCEALGQPGSPGRQITQQMLFLTSDALSGGETEKLVAPIPSLSKLSPLQRNSSLPRPAVPENMGGIYFLGKEEWCSIYR